MRNYPRKERKAELKTIELRGWVLEISVCVRPAVPYPSPLPLSPSFIHSFIPPFFVLAIYSSSHISSYPAHAQHVPDSRQADNAKKVRKMARALERQGLAAPDSMKKGSFFHHLPLYERKTSLTKTYDFNANCPVHPCFLKIGLQLREGRPKYWEKNGM